MLEMGVIEESNSDWCCPIVVVCKSDGSIRFCVEYRRVNEVPKFDAYPMPWSMNSWISWARLAFTGHWI